MKLITTLTFAALLSLAAIATASASDALVALWTDASGNGGYGTPPVNIKPSKNVSVAYFHSDATSGSGRLTCALSTWHASGTKTFATSSGDTKIYMVDSISQAAPAPPEAAGASADFSAWTAM